MEDVGRRSADVLGVRERDLEQHPDVGIIEAIEGSPTFATHRDHTMRA